MRFSSSLEHFSVYFHKKGKSAKIFTLFRVIIKNMEQEGKLNIEYNPSAFKHGVTEEDIRFAFDNKLFDHPVALHEEKTC